MLKGSESSLSSRDLIAKKSVSPVVGKQMGLIWKYPITYLQNKSGENRIKEAKFFGDGLLFASLIGNSGSYFIIHLQHQKKFLIENNGPIVHYQVSFPWVVTLHQVSSQEFELLVVNIESNDQKRSKITADLDLSNFIIIENSMINTTKNGFRLFDLANLSIENYTFVCGSQIDFPIGEIFVISGTGTIIVVQSRDKNQFFVYDYVSKSKLFQDFSHTPLTFVPGERTDLFVVYQAKKLLFRSFSEAYYIQDANKDNVMTVINLPNTISTVLVHENFIYIADYSYNIFVYDSAAQLVLNFCLQDLMLTSVISKLMIVNDNCLVVNTCILGQNGTQSSLSLSLYPLVGDIQKPIYQFQSKIFFGNAEIKKVDICDDVINICSDHIIVSWLVQKEKTDKEFLVLTNNNEFFSKIFFSKEIYFSICCIFQ